MVDAVSMQAEVEADRWTWDGHAQGRVELGAYAIHHSWTAAPDHVGFEADDWAVRLYDSPVVTAGPDPRHPMVRAEEPEDLVDEWSESGSVRILELGPEFSLRILPPTDDGSLDGSLNESVAGEGGLGIDPFGAQGLDPRGPRHESLDRSLWPPFRVAGLTGAPAPSGTGPVLVFLYDLKVELPSGKEIVLGPSDDPVTGPGTAEEAQRTHRYYLTMEATAWKADGPWFWLVKGLDLRFAGRLAFQDADGKMELDGEAQPWNKTLVVADGAFNVSMQAAPGHQTWSIAGAADTVGIDGRTVAEMPDPVPTIAIATGSGFALWAIWLLVSRHLLRDPLENGVRQRIYQAIEDNDGLRLREVQRVTGKANGQAVYHLRVLRMAGLVQRQRTDAGAMYVVTGTQPLAAVRSTAARSTELRKLLALIGENEGSVQGDVVEAASKRLGWPRSTTRYRLGRLEKFGLINAQRRGRECRYFLE